MSTRRTVLLLVHAAAGLLMARGVRAQVIINTQLSVGHVGVNYPGWPLVKLVGNSCYQSWSISAGPLPAGMTFGDEANGGGGQFFGAPTVAGDFPITVRVTLCGGPAFIEKSFVLSIRANADAPPSATEWTPRGSLGGTVKRLEISPDYASDGILFASGAGGDLYRTVDRGVTWQRIEVNPAELDAEITGLALSPNFSGGGATTAQRTVFIATRDYGVWKSTDLGLTFSPASSGLPCDGAVACPEGVPDVRALALSPGYATDSTLWAVVNAPDNGGSSVLYRSINGGASWTQRAVIVTGAVNHGVEALAPSPLFATDNTLFAGGHNVDELQYDAAGVFRSTDGGASWARVLVGYANQFSFSPDYATDGRIYSTHLTGQASAVSTDFGATWPGTANCRGPVTMVGGGGGPVKRYHFDSSPYLAQYVSNPYRYYAVYSYYDDCAFDGYRSLSRGLPLSGYTGGGSPLGPDEMQLKLAPPVAGVRHQWIFGNFGVYVSLDEGVTFQARQGFMRNLQARGLGGAGEATIVAAPGGWLLAQNGPSGWIRPFPGVHSWGVAMSPNYAVDRTVWVAQNRWYDSPEIYRTTTDGLSGNWTGGYHIRGMSFAPGFNTATGTVFHADSSYGVRYSTDGGQYFNGNILLSGNCPFSDGNSRETDGVAVSPAFATDQTVYAAMTKYDNSGMLCRSVDGGVTWSLVTTPAGLTAGRVALSPTYNHASGANGTPAKTLLYAANNGAVYRSTDGGATWSAVTGLPATGFIAQPHFSPLFAADGTAFLAAGPIAGSLFVPGRHAGIWRSSDFGASFAPLGAGDGLKTRRVTGLHFYPGFDGRLTANSRVLVSTDGASLWLSGDGGRTFAQAEDFSQAGRQVTLGLASGTDLYFASQERGIARSADSGRNFSELNSGLTPGRAATALGASSASVTRPLAGLSADGLWRLDSAGTAWQRISSAAISNTGTYVGFAEDATYLYALRADGTSARTPKAIGTWTALQSTETSLVAMNYNGSTGPTTLAEGAGNSPGPKTPAGTTASLWALSSANGPRWSSNNGTNWTAAPGTNDYTAPAGQTWKFVQTLGINAASGAREVLIGSTAGLWLTRDGGDTWRRVDAPGSGLEATSRNFSTVLTSLTATNSTDILVGAVGTTTGGVYLSGDGGEHWTQVNQGFDPNNLSISTLAKTSCAGCPTQYYTGSYGGGLYTRTIAVLPAPTVTGWNYGNAAGACGTTAGSGPEQGGTPFKLCGSDFQAGAIVEFDGMAATGCNHSAVPLAITCATPPHIPGPARVRVRNPDTRTGAASTAFTYVAGAPRITNSLRVTRAGADAALSWNCPGCTAANPARVYRAQNPAFTLFPEQYNGGISGSFTNTGAAGSNYGYFWRVE